MDGFGDKIPDFSSDHRQPLEAEPTGNTLLAQARKWAEPIEPILNRHREIQHEMAADLMMLSSICSYADGVYCEREMIFLTLCALPLYNLDSPEWKILSEEIRTAAAYNENWTPRLLQYPEAYRIIVKEQRYRMPAQAVQTPGKLYELGAKPEEIRLILNALGHFAESFMKADGKVPPSEEAVLKQIARLLGTVSGASTPETTPKN